MDIAPLDLLASLLGLALCAVIVGIAEPAINRMHARSASFLARLVFALYVTGGVGGILEILGGQVPDALRLLLFAVAALALALARRTRLISSLYDTPEPKGHPHAQG